MPEKTKLTMNSISTIIASEVKTQNSIAKMFGTILDSKEIETIKMDTLHSLCLAYEVYVPGVNLEEKLEYARKTLNVEEQFFRDYISTRELSMI